jgi:3-methyladenine DNA glycosylase/8-oxoguanine DNA glycosylase
MKLQKTIVLKPKAPFSFNYTFHKPDHFTKHDDIWIKDTVWQALNWHEISLGIKFSNEGTIEASQIKAEIYSHNSLPESYIESLRSEIEFRYNLNLGLKDFYDQFKNDKQLSEPIKKLYGMRPGHPNSLYEYLIIGVLLQNTFIGRSVKMFNTLLENYGTEAIFDNKRLFCFWTPGAIQNITEEELRELKVGYRAKSIKKIDDYFYNKNISELELRKSNLETQKKELLKIYGVGPATIWYILFDVFHNWHHFDHISPFEQKIYSKVFFGTDIKLPVEKKELLQHIDRYGKYKHIAIHYIWENLFWKRKNEKIEWLEKEIRT